MRCALFAIAMTAAISPAGAAEPYLDDRSTPEALIKSLYNAVSRGEYARAWSYFGKKPVQSFEAYAEGYADTASVRVIVGIASEHDAGDTIHYYVPVAIEASTGDGGNYQVYGGCYELTLANPQLQGEDFTPLQIAGASLSPSSGGMQHALPDTCDDIGAPDRSVLYERRAVALFHQVFGYCEVPPDTLMEDALTTHVARFRYTGAAGPEDAEDERHIYQFLCNRGAYNESHVYIMGDEHGEMKVLGFATPELDIRYEDAEHAKVESVDVIGYRAETELVNSFFDPNTLTIASHARWRGVGDASSTGLWLLRDGEFTLVRYEVDASYDGEINPETVLDYYSAP